MAHQWLTPDHVPRMEVEFSPAADACAGCGGKLRRIGEDITEELEYVLGTLHRPRSDGGRWLVVVNRIVRPADLLLARERFFQALLPTEAMLAHVLVSKYADHQPLL